MESNDLRQRKKQIKKQEEIDSDEDNNSEEKFEDSVEDIKYIKLENKYLTKFLILYEKYYSLILLIGVIASVSVITIFLIAVDECRQCFSKINDKEIHNIIHKEHYSELKKFVTFGKGSENVKGHLENVHIVLNRLGYEHVALTNDSDSDWDLLWAHDYPFRQLYSMLNNLKPHQKVNHFPGCGYITRKVDLATSGLKYIPPAFKLPEDKEKLLKYVQEYPNKSFVEKDNDHRKIHIRKIEEIDLNKEGTFVQEYVDKPLLVNGYRFDIGIYTVITSIDPLRIYIYNGEALLRFCTEKYHPFDPENLNKYVVGDDYLPTWEVPDLQYFYNHLGFGMKESLNAHLRQLGKNPEKLWNHIEDAIRNVILAKEPLIIDVASRFKSTRNFFEMMRFDFLADDDLNVYLLEANMSPNLSSAHFKQNQLMYQQVLYNVLGLVGVGEMVQRNSLEIRNKQEEEMIVSDKHLAVFGEQCGGVLCKSSCTAPVCQLCKNCLTPETRESLVEAVKEHLRKGDCKRIFPPSMTKNEAASNEIKEDLSVENQLHQRWFQGKCLQETSWC